MANMLPGLGRGEKKLGTSVGGEERILTVDTDDRPATSSSIKIGHDSQNQAIQGEGSILRRP